MTFARNRLASLMLMSAIAIATTACGGGDGTAAAAADTSGTSAGTGATSTGTTSTGSTTTAGTSSSTTTTTAAAAVPCDTKLFVPDSVTSPSAAQLTAYAGTYAGDEGSFGANPGDPFAKTGSATLVLGADGSASYQGTKLTVTSVCVEKVAGTYGILLYVHTALGHFDISDRGEAWGVSPVDGTTLFRNGKK